MFVLNHRCLIHLISQGTIQFPKKHNPSFTANLAIKLYFLSRPKIEVMRHTWQANAWISKLLTIFFQEHQSWPTDLHLSCYLSRNLNLPVWDNGRCMVNPEFWGGHHPKPDLTIDPLMRTEIHIIQPETHDMDLLDWAHRDFEIVDWNPVNERTQEAHEDNQAIVPQGTEAQPENDKESTSPEGQVVPQATPIESSPLRTVIEAIPPDNSQPDKLSSAASSSQVFSTSNAEGLSRDFLSTVDPIIDQFNAASETVAAIAADNLMDSTNSVDENNLPTDIVSEAIRQLAHDFSNAPAQEDDILMEDAGPAFSPLTPQNLSPGHSEAENLSASQVSLASQASQASSSQDAPASTSTPDPIAQTVPKKGPRTARMSTFRGSLPPGKAQPAKAGKKTSLPASSNEPSAEDSPFVRKKGRPQPIRPRRRSTRALSNSSSDSPSSRRCSDQERGV